MERKHTLNESHGTWKSSFQEIVLLNYSFTCSFGVFLLWFGISKLFPEEGTPSLYIPNSTSSWLTLMHTGNNASRTSPYETTKVEMSRSWLSLVLIGGWGSAAAGESASVVLHCGPTLTAKKEWNGHICWPWIAPASFILVIVSIHICSSNIQNMCQSYWKNACLAKKVVLNTEFSPGFFLQDSWGFLKASKEEQRQRSKVRPENYLMNLVVQVVSSKKTRAAQQMGEASTVWWFRKSSGFHRKDVGGFLKWWVSPTTNYWFSY